MRAGDADLTFYYQADDPYSHLLAQVVPRLCDAYPLTPRMVVVGTPPKDASPEPELRSSFGARDARDLAAYYDVDFPDGPDEVAAHLVRRAECVLARQRPFADQLAAALAVGSAVWSGSDEAMGRAEADYGKTSESTSKDLLEHSYANLRRAGHYQGGMLLYGGEWYWGIDRLWYLEQRLRAEGADDTGSCLHLRPESERPAVDSADSGSRLVLDFYYSFRSPYSYIATKRTLDLGKKFPVEVRIKPVLPMVMRGYEVPLPKRLYIVQDAKREAKRHGVAFGRICDPVGVGVERCLSIFPLAESAGRAGEFLESAGRGIWSEARDVASDDDLKVIVERSGLGWNEARARLGSDDWRQLADENRRQLLSLGLWGVPSYRLGTHATWGQDRLWMLEDRIRRHFGQLH